MARTLADFYRKQPPSPEISRWGTVGKLSVSTDENFSQTEDFIGKTISRPAFEAIRAFTNACYEQAPRVVRKAGGGRVDPRLPWRSSSRSRPRDG